VRQSARVRPPVGGGARGRRVYLIVAAPCRRYAFFCRAQALALALATACGPAGQGSSAGAGGPPDVSAPPAASPPAPAEVATKAPEQGATSFTAGDRAKLLQKTLDLDLLAPFWHAPKGGRPVLRVVRGEAVEGEPPLSLSGERVVYVDRAAARAGGGRYFEFTKLEPGPDRVRVEFRYPSEGVIGHVVFRRAGGDWAIDEKQVAEH
jgi:hypothetical protein